MSFGKMNTFISLVEKQFTQDDDRFRLKALIILRELLFHNGDEGVHLSKAHVTPSIPGRAEAEG